MPGMKSKTIKSVLNKKINQWIESVEDPQLQEQLKKSVIVTGGAIVSMLEGNPVNDFDIYLRNKETVKAVAEYYVKRFTSARGQDDPIELLVIDKDGRVKINARSNGVSGMYGFEGRDASIDAESARMVVDNPEAIEDVYQETEQTVLNQEEPENKFRPVFLTSNAITLSNKVQIVLRFYGEPDEIHEWYDFVHCTNYWTNWNNSLVLRPEALEAILTKELKYVGSKYPICSIVRLRKFINRGWRINAGQIVKMAMQISELDLKNPDVLEDQLTGVDTQYFIELIAKIKEKDPEKVNTAYLCEIIDRLF